MRNFFLVAVAALSMTACRQNDSVIESDSSFDMKSASAEYTSQCSKPVQTVSGNITSSNNHWTADKIWEIDGIVNVQSGVTLTIEPGTFIKAKPKTNNTASGVLVVQKGGKLIANGTSTAPIVFTSYNLLDCDGDTGGAPGDFGGIVILGDAPINTGTATIEGLSGSQYEYGGTNSAHNGGSLTYVRIEYGGFDLLAPNSGNEINGLTLGGVGNGTTLDHIQVSYGKDDAFEWFGGTVNASNLIAFAQDDDGFDFDNGYVGTITNALALADFNSTHSLSGGNPDSNGIELDNNAGGTSTPLLTHPIVNGLTIIGARNNTQGALYENGIHIRRHGQLTLNDALVTGYPTGIRVEGTGSALAALNLSTIYAHGFTTATIGTPAISNTATGTPAATFFLTGTPFFNSGSWSIAPRTWNYNGAWTNYSF
ncbi:hypothetical protein LPB90_09440 [Chryseobacterium sp. LC2016-29]|uniref:hypothetical protein n=1 Tax=Chryseobacterium sp. LC2016-29 TaxID=2897331 RepID=UPI001E640971|nr:hypothetical protein [Chryseobacterium sp. LC2016-29]MCD0478682.1 hypothetical protein [Chryseobacterium sp. LC2016-29]